MRNFKDCLSCMHRNSAKCLPCTMGQNFEPIEEEGLNFDKINFGNSDWDEFGDED